MLGFLRRKRKLFTDEEQARIVAAAYADAPELPERNGRGKQVKWPTGLGAKGNEGVAGQVKQMPGAIGYVDYSDAKATGLKWAKVKNKAGKFVDATLEGWAQYLKGGPAIEAANAGAVAATATTGTVQAAQQFLTIEAIQKAAIDTPVSTMISQLSNQSSCWPRSSTSCSDSPSGISTSCGVSRQAWSRWGWMRK